MTKIKESFKGGLLTLVSFLSYVKSWTNTSQKKINTGQDEPHIDTVVP